MTLVSFSNSPAPLLLSPLQRSDALQGTTISVCIYRLGAGGWHLRVMNSRGRIAVWRHLFDSDVQ